MTQFALADALTLTDDGHGGLTARLDPGFSNAPQAMDPTKGAPFGGLMAALAAGAARQGLGLDTPLQTLSIQYLAAARFEPATFRPTLTPLEDRATPTAATTKDQRARRDSAQNDRRAMRSSAPRPAEAQPESGRPGAWSAMATFIPTPRAAHGEAANPQGVR